MGIEVEQLMSTVIHLHHFMIAILKIIGSFMMATATLGHLMVGQSIFKRQMIKLRMI